MALFAITIFLAAFLLFQVQPIIAKAILPWYGGSSAVWSTCMLFFQAALLAGYLYAHWLDTIVSPRKRATVHCALLALSLVSLPVIPNPAWRDAAAGNPSWTILGLLVVTVGLPYFLLSTTSPLIQAWYARAHSTGMPYRLYALSNFGSMLALLSYPVLIEPNLATRLQAQIWSLAYTAFAVGCGWMAWRYAGAAGVLGALATNGDAGPPPALSMRLLWMSLAACASILLLAITSFLTQDVAAIPFLWIAPLVVYLLSFILTFEAPWFYVRPVFLALAPVALGGTAYLLLSTGGLGMVATIWLLLGALFVFAMVCHGELVRLKPHPRYLTAFYVMLALGGAAGGVLVGLVAPNLFNAYYEFPIGLGLCAVLVALTVVRRRRSPALALGLAALVAAYLGLLVYVVEENIRGYRVVKRNFYSQIRVRDDELDDDVGPRRKLLHGVINHGEQILDEAYRRRPVTYFCPDTGVGRAMSMGTPGTPRRIGILGLGIGTLAAYGRPGDVFRIYEINPQVVEVARSEFTYLRDTSARVETVLGDGRLTLEHDPDQRFDVLVMDAFSGDSVPVHLITREAFATYLRHLKPGGILAVNVSNKYLELRPVMERAARHFGREALYFSFQEEDEDTVCFSVGWVLIVDEATRRAYPALQAGEVLAPNPRFRLWTDDFSNMLNILK